MEKINAVITGVGGYVPKYILDNDEMSRIVDTTDEWIMERIGVKTRHILRDEERQGAGTSYLMTKAVEELMAKTQVDPDTIEAVICATTTPDYHFPSTASLVIGNLGFKHAFGFDMEAACAGFLYAMEVGASMITSGRRKRIIVCGGDFMSSMTNYMDRTTCPIFGDGAACVMMEATTEDYGLIESFLRTDSHFEPLHMAAGGSAKMPSHETVDAREHFVYQEGRTVFKYAVTDMSDAVEEIAKRHNLGVEFKNDYFDCIIGAGNTATRIASMNKDKKAVADSWYKKAISYYEKAKEMAPDQSDQWGYPLYASYYNSGNMAKAKEYQKYSK